MNLRHLLFSLFFLIFGSSFSQNEKKIDSLLTLIKNTNVDTTKAKEHLSIALLVMYQDSEKAKNNIDLAEKLYSQSPNLKGSANLNSIKAQYMYTQSAYDSSMLYVEKASDLYLKNGDSLKAAITKSNLANLVKVFSRDNNRLQRIIDEIEPIATKYKDTILIASTLGNRADIALSKGHRNIAINLTKRVIQLREASKDSIRLPQAYFKIGRIYQELFDYEESIINFDQGIAIEDALGNQRIKAQLLKIKATSLIKLKKYTAAEKSLLEGLKISKTIDFKSNISGTLIRLGSLELARKNYTKANSYLNEANTLMNSTNVFSVDYNYNLIKGKIHLGKKQYATALDYFEKCVKINENKESLVNLSNSKKFQSQALEKLGDYKNALAIFKESSDLKDTINSQLRTTLSVEQKIIYETEKKEKEIALQKKDIEILKEKEKATKLKNGILTILVISLISIFSLLFYALRQRIKKNRIIQENLNKDLEYKTKELTTHALHLAKKNEVLSDLKDKAKVLKADANADPGYQMLIQTINFDLQDDKNWENFSRYFEEVHTDFNVKAQQQYPNITSNDLRLMALLKMNLSSKEIANILNISSDGIKKARQRLRKKLGISSEESLEATVIAI